MSYPIQPAQHKIVDSVENIVAECHGLAKASGWWKSEHFGDIDEVFKSVPFVDSDVREYVQAWIGSKLMLICSEVSEAMEAHRKNQMDDHLPHRLGLEVELADALIRICDLAGGLDLDLAGALKEKLKYNKNRADHKLENRRKDGGKSI